MSSREQAESEGALRHANAAAELSKIAKLLGIIATKEQNLQDRVSQLRSVGFSPAEIGSMLQISTNHVGVALHKSKAKQGRKVAKREK